jgi:hypothetical protein
LHPAWSRERPAEVLTTRHHEVSILISAGTGVGRCLGAQPRAKVSMMIMRPPQHGGNVDIIRSPIRASILPDRTGHSPVH